ncbi:MAG TPA: lipopolysaccharide core heptose(I) kinase RfaP [Burkholderiales bacterium]
MNNFFITPELRDALGGHVAFDTLLNMPGQVFRQVERRRTVRFEAGGKAYFVKAHYGVGWREIFKNLFTLRLPVLGATNEWLAIRRVEALGLRAPTIAAYGVRGSNPAARESFLVTEDVGSSISLEDYCRGWREAPPGFVRKQDLIREVALISKALHEGGVNHRDYYLCHFLRPLCGNDTGLVVIDLHRAQIRRITPRRWIVKDIGGLYFSAMDIGLTQRDLFRFMKIYRGRSLRELLKEEDALWSDVRRRALRLYQE